MTRLVPVTLDRAPHASESWRATLERHATLQDAWDWMRAQHPPLDVTDVVVQDEFTHDVVVRLTDDLFAVYDTT